MFPVLFLCDGLWERSPVKGVFGVLCVKKQMYRLCCGILCHNTVLRGFETVSWFAWPLACRGLIVFSCPVIARLWTGDLSDSSECCSLQTPLSSKASWVLNVWYNNSVKLVGWLGGQWTPAPGAGGRVLWPLGPLTFAHTHTQYAYI